MFRTKTLFVLGAGASCELNFPSGAALLEQIASAVNMRFSNGYNMDQGDTRIYQACEQLCRNQSNTINNYLHAGWRVRDAATLGLSIDNVIHQLDGDPLAACVGKLAIARSMLQAEKTSILRYDRNERDNYETLRAARATWLGVFVQLLVQDVPRRYADQIFDNVSVISFNYDRSVKQFLPMALNSQFAMSEAESIDLAKRLNVFHPYGSLGKLDWEGAQRDVVQFGAAEYADLNLVAGGLRTFTEQIEEGAHLDDMRAALAEATNIIFLGFGYHAQNMALLTQNLEGGAHKIYGTALGLSDADCEVVSRSMAPLFREPFRDPQRAVLVRSNSYDFLGAYFKTLTA